KLRKVNEARNPHIVTILSSGITDTGSFPYIEMEYIEGPDLEELLKPPHKPIFRIAEVVKAARHIANALAHCHKAGVKHGDIKPNNIKLNTANGNYVLLDFGLALLLDEEQRKSLRHAGAIEFMAPEQNEGRLLFQSDVYSFGIILYELLAGTVPFPLNAGGETARNEVMVAHIEKRAPALLPQRLQKLPGTWSQDKREFEMKVPQWLLSVIEKCLQKDPALRFPDGVELHLVMEEHYYQLPSVAQASRVEEPVKTDPVLLPEPAVADRNEQLVVSTVATYEREDRQEDEPIVQAGPSYETASSREEEPLLTSAAASAQVREREPGRGEALVPPKPRIRRGDRPIIKKNHEKRSLAGIVLPLLGTVLFAIAIYGYFNKDKAAADPDTVIVPGPLQDSSLLNIPAIEIKEAEQASIPEEPLPLPEREVIKEAPPLTLPSPTARTAPKEDRNRDTNTKVQTLPDERNATADLGKYKVRSKAFFHTEPDASTRRNAFIVHWNNAVLKPLDQRDDFVYIVFTNTEGQTSKGWLRVQDLIKVGN
ncbi:MAG: serine/threonine-protein kinase, partial [Chitinophagaceae bacterium]